jgi:hypothetical protein
MPRPRRPLDPSRPMDSFALALRDLHRGAGRPKHRVLAAAINASNASVSAILNGHRFPSWEQTQRFVQACGGDTAEWKQLWMRADKSRATDYDVHGDRIAAVEPTLKPVAGSEFYRAMLIEIQRARYRIMTSYIRLRPASYFLRFTDDETSRAAAAYFDGIIAWSSRPGRRSVRRIIATPNEEMRVWAQKLVHATANHPNYHVRVIDWPLQADAVNFAIFDDVVAFIAFTTGTTQREPGRRGRMRPRPRLDRWSAMRTTIRQGARNPMVRVARSFVLSGSTAPGLPDGPAGGSSIRTRQASSSPRAEPIGPAAAPTATHPPHPSRTHAEPISHSSERLRTNCPAAP